LNESEGSSEDEGIDSETLDTESELHGFEVLEVLLWAHSKSVWVTLS
jgi:hypothetical protein